MIWKSTFLKIILTSFILLVMCRVGNAYEFPTFGGIDLKLSGIISENYSNNVTFASDKEDQIDSLMTALGLALSADYKGKRREFGLAGRFSQQFDNESGDFLNPTESISLRFRNEFSELSSVTINNVLTHTQIPETFEDEFGRVKGKFNQYTNSFTVSHVMAISKYFSIDTDYNNGLTWSKRKDLNDSVNHRIGFTLRYNYDDSTSFNIPYNYAIRIFQDSGDISNHNVSLGLTKQISDRASFDISAGMSFSYIDDNSISTGSNISASLNNSIDEKSTVSISFTRGDSINSDTEDIFRNWRINSRLSRVMTEDLNGSANLFYGVGDFVSSGEKDKLFGVTLSSTYKLWEDKKGKRINGSLNYTLSKQDSSDSARGYTRSSFSAGLIAGF